MTPSPPRGARERAPMTVDRLRDLYPAATELLHENPFQLLIATILSAQTTDRSVNSITPELFRRYPTPDDLAAADPAAVQTLIKPTGFFRAKTARIIAASRKLVEVFGGVVPEDMDDLVKIPGIGRKTANVILGAGFGVPGFAVDTHVNRLTNRIGLVRTHDPVKIEFQVCSMVPDEEWTGLSLRLILHGRRICDARRPLCSECVLNDFCPSSLTQPDRRLQKGRPIPEAPGSDIKLARTAAKTRSLALRAHPPPGGFPPPARQPSPSVKAIDGRDGNAGCKESNGCSIIIEPWPLWSRGSPTSVTTRSSASPP